MPRKSEPPLTDEERAKRIRETAREIGASESKKDFERAFQKITDAAKSERKGK
ncbi:MAG TPA: hypothetical protein VMV19_04690 [Xanthobacteraceae bacterium]|nr:hypothetical protein [Xanthobacteraceae bacterium]